MKIRVILFVALFAILCGLHTVTCTQQYSDPWGWSSITSGLKKAGNWLKKKFCVIGCKKKEKAKPVSPPTDNNGNIVQGSSKAAKCVQDANRYRLLHQNTPPAYEDPDLSKAAQLYAEKLLKLGRLQHDPPKGVGENLAGGSQSRSLPRDFNACHLANSGWYREMKDYTDPNYTKKPAVGHYTQMVWTTSTRVGYGFAQDDKNWYVVARYSPGGNVVTNAVTFMFGGVGKLKAEKVQPCKKPQRKCGKNLCAPDRNFDWKC